MPDDYGGKPVGWVGNSGVWSPESPAQPMLEELKEHAPELASLLEGSAAATVDFMSLLHVVMEVACCATRMEFHPFYLFLVALLAEAGGELRMEVSRMKEIYTQFVGSNYTAALASRIDEATNEVVITLKEGESK